MTAKKSLTAYLATPDKLASALFVFDHLEKSNHYHFLTNVKKINLFIVVIVIIIIILIIIIITNISINDVQSFISGTVCVLKPRPQQRKSHPSLGMMMIMVMMMVTIIFIE